MKQILIRNDVRKEEKGTWLSRIIYQRKASRTEPGHFAARGDVLIQNDESLWGRGVSLPAKSDQGRDEWGRPAALLAKITVEVEEYPGK